MNDTRIINSNEIPAPVEAPYDWAGVGHSDDLASEYAERDEVRGTFAAETAEELPYDGWEGCWPGDGSGMDDLADLHASEGGDW